MPKAPRRVRPHPRLRWLLGHVLLLVQAVVVFTAVVEGRAGVGVSAHVEEQGAGHHYAHAEANCAYCAARSIHATAAPAPGAPRVRTVHDGLPIARAIEAPQAEPGIPHHSRAPPAIG